MTSHKKGPPAAGHITRRKKGAERKRLDPDLEAFARSDEKKFRPRREQRPRLTDPRPTFLISGISNRDARMVLDARTAALGKLEPGEAYDRHLAEVTWLRLWRGRNFTAFDSYAEDVLGVNPAEAQAAAERGAKAAGRDLRAFDDETTAIWLRAEAAAVDAGGTIEVRVIGNKISLTFDVANAPQMIHAAGRRMTPLVHDREPQEADAPPPRRREAEASKKKRRP